MSTSRPAAPADGLLSTPITQGSPVSEVAKRLLDYLTTGAVQSGERLPSERELAARFQVGRSAVREALAALDLLGVVAIRQGSGTYFNTSSTDLLPQVIDWGLMIGQPQMLDLVEARRHLEVVTSKLAAVRATPDSLARLEESLERMKSTAGDRRRFVEADVAFHLVVADIADNSVLEGILHSVGALLRVWITRAVSRAGQTEQTIAEHTAVYLAISSGDAAAAAAAMEEHMERANARLTSSLGLE
jgi:DNA-binding FadR family transcriptional regulator